MSGNSWNAGDDRLPTATLADACVRLNVPFQIAPITIRPVIAGTWCSGPARPIRHQGSVDIVLAALDEAADGDILVIDNGGRTDEGCVGDLVVLEAAAVGIGGLVIWGCHRDTPGLVAIDLPVFSLGANAVGPRRRDHAASCLQVEAVSLGPAVVTPGDLVVADDDGVLAIPPEHIERVLPAAREIQRTEQAQASALADGQTLRDQLRFDAYRALRRRNPGYGFREHVRVMQAAIEA